VGGLKVAKGRQATQSMSDATLMFVGGALGISGRSGTGIGVNHDSFSREILDQQVSRGVGIREGTVRQRRWTVLERTSPSG